MVWSHEVGWLKWFLVAPFFPRQTNPDSRLLPVGCCLQQFRDAPHVDRCVAGRAEDTIHASRAWNYAPDAGQAAGELVKLRPGLKPHVVPSTLVYGPAEQWQQW